MPVLLRGDTGFKAGHGDSLRLVGLTIGAGGTSTGIIDPAAWNWGYDLPGKDLLTLARIKTWVIGTTSPPTGYSAGDCLLAIGPSGQLTGDNYGPPFQLKGSIILCGLDLAPTGRLYGANGPNATNQPTNILVRGIDAIFNITFAADAAHWTPWQQEPNDYVTWPIVFFCNSRVNFAQNGCKFGKLMRVKVSGALPNAADFSYAGPKAAVIVNKVDIVKGPLSVNNEYTSTGVFLGLNTMTSGHFRAGGGVPEWRFADVHADLPMGRFFDQADEAFSVCGFPRSSRLRLKNTVFEHTVRWATGAADPVQTGGGALVATSPRVLALVSGAAAIREVSDYASGRYWPALLEATNFIWRGFDNPNTNVSFFLDPADGVTGWATDGTYSFATGTVGSTAQYPAYDGQMRLLAVGQARPANPVVATHIGIIARLTGASALLNAIGLSTEPDIPADEDYPMDGLFYGLDATADQDAYSPYRYRRPVAVRFRAEVSGFLLGVRLRNRFNEAPETDATSDRSAGNGGTIRLELRRAAQDDDLPPLASGTGEDRYAPLVAGDVNLLGRTADMSSPISIGRYPSIDFQNPIPITRNERYWIVFHQLDDTRTRWVSIESNQLMGFNPAVTVSNGGPWWRDDLRIAEAGPPAAGTPSFAWRSTLQPGFSRHLAKVQPHYRSVANRDFFGGIGTAFAAGVSVPVPIGARPKDPGTAAAGKLNRSVTDRASFLAAYAACAVGDHIVCQSGTYTGDYTLNRSFAAPGIVIRGAAMAANGMDPLAIFPGRILITGDGHWFNQLRLTRRVTGIPDRTVPTYYTVTVQCARVVFTRCWVNSNMGIYFADSPVCQDNKIGWCRFTENGGDGGPYIKIHIDDMPHGSTKQKGLEIYRCYFRNEGGAGVDIDAGQVMLGDGHPKGGDDRYIPTFKIEDNLLECTSAGWDKAFYIKCGLGSFSGNTVDGPASVYIRHASIQYAVPTSANTVTTISCPRFWSNWLNTQDVLINGAGVDLRSNHIESTLKFLAGSSAAGLNPKNAAHNAVMVNNYFVNAPAIPVRFGLKEGGAQTIDATQGGKPRNLQIWGHRGIALGTPAEMIAEPGWADASEIHINAGTGALEVPPDAVKLVHTDVAFERLGQNARS